MIERMTETIEIMIERKNGRTYRTINTMIERSIEGTINRTIYRSTDRMIKRKIEITTEIKIEVQYTKCQNDRRDDRMIEGVTQRTTDCD